MNNPVSIMLLFGGIAATYFVMTGFFATVLGWDVQRIVAVMAPLVVITMFLILSS